MYTNGALLPKIFFFGKAFNYSLHLFKLLLEEWSLECWVNDIIPIKTSKFYCFWKNPICLLGIADQWNRKGDRAYVECSRSVHVWRPTSPASSAAPSLLSHYILLLPQSLHRSGLTWCPQVKKHYSVYTCNLGITFKSFQMSTTFWYIRANILVGFG